MLKMQTKKIEYFSVEESINSEFKSLIYTFLVHI